MLHLNLDRVKWFLHEMTETLKATTFTTIYYITMSGVWQWLWMVLWEDCTLKNEKREWRGDSSEGFLHPNTRLSKPAENRLHLSCERSCDQATLWTIHKWPCMKNKPITLVLLCRCIRHVQPIFHWLWMLLYRQSVNSDSKESTCTSKCIGYTPKTLCITYLNFIILAH